VKAVFDPTGEFVPYLNSAGGQIPLIQYDLYTFSLTGGGMLLWTTADFPITAPTDAYWNAPSVFAPGTLWFSGMTWLPKVLDAEDNKATAHWKIGLDSDTWQVKIAPRPFDLATGNPFPDMIGDVPILQAAAAGALDSADVIVSRAYFAAVPIWPIPVIGLAPIGVVHIFRGLMGEADVTTSSLYLNINDYKSLLGQQMPRNLYQGSCRHLLYDIGCTLNAADFTEAGTAGVGSTQAVIVSSIGAPPGSGTYQLGTMTFTSGANEGVSRLISQWAVGQGFFAMLNPFPYPVSIGDAFSVTAGCDKQQSTCSAFNNLLNFGGDSYIPAPEVSLG